MQQKIIIVIFAYFISSFRFLISGSELDLTTCNIYALIAQKIQISPGLDSPGKRQLALSVLGESNLSSEQFIVNYIELIKVAHYTRPNIVIFLIEELQGIFEAKKISLQNQNDINASGALQNVTIALKGLFKLASEKKLDIFPMLYALPLSLEFIDWAKKNATETSNLHAARILSERSLDPSSSMILVTEGTSAPEGLEAADQDFNASTRSDVTPVDCTSSRAPSSPVTNVGMFLKSIFGSTELKPSAKPIQTNPNPPQPEAPEWQILLSNDPPGSTTKEHSLIAGCKLFEEYHGPNKSSYKIIDQLAKKKVTDDFH